jgi:GNAT superfamily N-acetyltransferase
MTMHTKITTRQAKVEDADTLVEFNLRMARETEDKKLDQRVLSSGVKAVLKDESLGFYLVAEVDESVVGSLMITKEWSDWRNGMFWWIQSVYVIPAYRRRGIFRALYETVRDLAAKNGQVCGFRLYVERGNTAARATYKKLGMEETKYRVLESVKM